jgi:hypothetical protein
MSLMLKLCAGFGGGRQGQSEGWARLPLLVYQRHSRVIVATNIVQGNGREAANISDANRLL